MQNTEETQWSEAIRKEENTIMLVAAGIVVVIAWIMVTTVFPVIIHLFNGRWGFV
jgi:hypothetical protein